MIVLYLKANDQFIQAIPGFPEIEERDNKLYFKGGKVILNDLTRAGHREYPDQYFVVPKEMDKEEVISEKAVTLTELNLREFTAEELKNLNRNIYAELDEVEARLLDLEKTGVEIDVV